MDATALIDQIRSEEEQLTQRKHDAAKDLREKAGELYRQASELQGEANLLTNQANELEGSGAPKDQPKAATVTASPKSTKPKSPKPARTPRPDGTVVATVALVKKSIAAIGGKGNKSAIRNHGDYTRASLDDVLKKDDFVITGRGKGAGTKYKVA